MKEKDDISSEEEPQDLETLFNLYARFGDRESDGTITLKNIDKWLNQAELLNKKGGVTHADTAITFSKIVKNKKRMDLKEFQEFIETLAIDKKIEPSELVDKLVATGEPKLNSVTTPVTEGAVGRNIRRMTATNSCTGHFDEESKSKEGRKVHSHTGHVSEKDKKDQKKEKDKKEEKDQKKEKDKKAEKDEKGDKNKE